MSTLCVDLSSSTFKSCSLSGSKVNYRLAGLEGLVTDFHAGACLENKVSNVTNTILCHSEITFSFLFFNNLSMYTYLIAKTTREKVIFRL